MPWKETRPMDEKVKFISKLLDGERMSDLCRDFGISRKTGHKFYKRYMAGGIRGLINESTKPFFCPHKTPEEIEKLIIKLRKKRSTWGPKKLKVKMGEIHPGITIPASSTIGEILKRYNIPLKKRSNRRKAYYNGKLGESREPNDIWSVDFKGQFRLGNQKYCYPLTVSDHYSRYILGIEALENTQKHGTMSAFENIFDEYGLPYAIRSDNGAPFATCGLKGWSELSVWWIKLGIRLERIEPGHPEQNGRHERMHWTLKSETTRPISPNQLHQQERFDIFRHEYNLERPHEAISMKKPGDLFYKSKRKYPSNLNDYDYPCHDLVSKVQKSGSAKIYKKVNFHLTKALAGEKVGLREIKPKMWLVSFINYKLGYFNENLNKFFENTEPEEATEPPITKSQPLLAGANVLPLDYYDDFL